MGRRGRATSWTSRDFCPNCQTKFGKRPAANFFCLNWGRNISPLCRFSDSFNAGYIINVCATFFFIHQLLTMVSKRHKNRVLAVKIIVAKIFLLYIFVLAVLPPIQIILKNHVLLYQMIIFVRVVCDLVGVTVRIQDRTQDSAQLLTKHTD